MIRLFLCSIITAFTIVGGVVGAGFITGKEIYVFFASDFSLSGIYLTFVCFTLSIYLIMFFKFKKVGAYSIGLFIMISNVIIAGCMFSAILELYARVFHQIKNIKILAIITAIFVFIVSAKGMGAMEKFSLFLIPVVIVSIVVLSLKTIDDKVIILTPKRFNGVFNPVIYVGFNIILCFSVIKNSGEKLSPPFKFISSLLSAIILFLLIFLSSLSVHSAPKTQKMPFAELFIHDVKLSIIVDIITLFAILTTYSSALYSSYGFCDFKLKIKGKILVFLTSLFISNLGFSKIVESIYPLIGSLGFALLIFTCLLSKIFQPKQRERTLRPLKCRE